MHLPPPPDPRELLPPLLACLPTAFASSNPPPALLPLLSPLLRQRVSFLSAGNQPTSRGDGWLPLLSWDGEQGARLPAAVERMELEPHPISGEVELDDTPPATYRRLDEETLQSRIDVEQFGLRPVYVWCDADEHGGTGPGWKLAELQALEDSSDAANWYETVSEANSVAIAKRSSEPQSTGGKSDGGSQSGASKGEEDDDAYWASYDMTPGRTPSKNRSPAPRQIPGGPSRETHKDRQAESEYFARYGNEVQPAMDSHDPDEEDVTMGESTVNGDSLLGSQRPLSRPNGNSLYPSNSARPDSRPNGASLYPPDQSTQASNHDRNHPLEAPRPLSPSSSTSSIQKLEEQAMAMSQQRDQSPDRTHMAIKQHISTDVKSLFRLAKSTGMNRSEFEEIVKRELEVLSLLEQDE